ncbi:protein-disulfide reductase DsbD [Pantoea sp. BAV 3049]|uniref:protein-disulfide reductase DsbD family protein n=1 Tax=Pantoea sp. BAV 3049 TaxID=2654188 RepID=UPI00131C730A|nr:thioredoxin family protein [Pantoea sp. BAV 3049]
MLTAILSAFLGGIILNFMPCVFPVISLKALGLLRHQGSPSGARAEGLAFLAGVVVTMLALAGILLAARATGNAVGWGFQLQSPLVIAILALIILAAAINLLGVFEVGLSLQRVGEIEMGSSSLVRSALTGALAIVVATPCSAPFMASAVGYALVQPPAVSLAIFFSLAVGFAAPFTVVSLFPQLAKHLPRPGAWMDILKRGLAFPMLGAWAWLVWVLAQQAGTAALATILACSVLLSFTAWMYGMAQKRRFSGKPHKVMFAVTLVLFVAVIAPISAIMQPGSPLPDGQAAPTVTQVKWSPQTVAAERGHGKAILVDFTASWCITCQVNQRTTLSTNTVKQALLRTGTVYMVADSTKFNPDIDDVMSEFGQGGLPLYIVYPADGSAPKVLPQVLTPSIVVNALEQASGKKV